MASLVSTEESIEVEGVGGRKPRKVLRKDLAEVLEPRAEETLQLIHSDLQSSGLLNLLGSGVVLTGGASHLDGLVEMGEFIFDVPIRRGSPGKVGGLTDVIKSASFSTAVGLLLYGFQRQKYLDQSSQVENGFSFGEVSKKFRNLLDDLF